LAVPAFPPDGGNEGMERNSPLRPLRPGRRRPGRGSTLTIRTRGCALGKSAFPPDGGNETDERNSQAPAASTRSAPDRALRLPGHPCQRLRLGEVSVPANRRGRRGGTQQPAPIASTRSSLGRASSLRGHPYQRLRLGEVGVPARRRERGKGTKQPTSITLCARSRHLSYPRHPQPEWLRRGLCGQGTPRPFGARLRLRSAAACGVSMTAPASSPPRPRGYGYTVTFRPQPARRSCLSARPNDNPNVVGPVPAPHPTRGPKFR
jgi:hypothetical protein